MKSNLGENINDYSSVGDYVYAEIRRRIISWDLKPGQRISEAEMSKILDVSRTPVREGFIRLKNEGLVEILSQRGTIISKIDLKKVRDGVFIRNCLEREVIKEIAGHLEETYRLKCLKFLKKQEESLVDRDYIKFHQYDVAFHKVFYEAANRENAWGFIQYTNAQYERVRMLTLLDFDKFKHLLEVHNELFNAIVEGNFEVAAAITESHISRIFDEIDVLQREHEAYFIDEI
ncbi:MAG: GntR family transcriptional regulator [Clostridia bacterium]|nr:GntR family transcriptional regulator [Clostridia bacterium]